MTGYKEWERHEVFRILLSEKAHEQVLTVKSTCSALHPGQTTTAQVQDKASPHLALNVADWKKIANADGSCIRHDHQQNVGADVYIPDTNLVLWC